MPNQIHDREAFLLLAAVLTVGANAFVLTPILSEVATDLASLPSRIAWSISAFGSGTAISAMTLANLADRHAAGRILGGAIALLALAQLSSGLSHDWLWLCLSQFIAGLASGVILPASYATAAKTAPLGREAARLGFILTGWSLSLTLAVPAAAMISGSFGWRAVYVVLATLSGILSIGLRLNVREPVNTSALRIPPWRALQIPDIRLLLLITFAYTTAFYGSFAFFGEGLKQAFGISPEQTSIFILAYGLGLGVAGVGLTITAPKISGRYFAIVLACIGSSYACWAFALATPLTAFVGSVAWGILNQLGLNALIVCLSRRAGDARSAVMGLNTGVTYLAVFAGPIVMSPIFSRYGFTWVAFAAGSLLVISAIASRKVR